MHFAIGISLHPAYFFQSVLTFVADGVIIASGGYFAGCVRLQDTRAKRLVWEPAERTTGNAPRLSRRSCPGRKIQQALDQVSNTARLQVRATSSQVSGNPPSHLVCRSQVSMTDQLTLRSTELARLLDYRSYFTHPQERRIPRAQLSYCRARPI